MFFCILIEGQHCIGVRSLGGQRCGTDANFGERWADRCCDRSLPCSLALPSTLGLHVLIPTPHCTALVATSAMFCKGVGQQQQCGRRAEYRRSRGRTTGTAGNTFDANMDSLQQIYTPWIRSDGDAPRGNNKEFRIQKALLTEAISRRRGWRTHWG